MKKGKSMTVEENEKGLFTRPQAQTRFSSVRFNPLLAATREIEVFYSLFFWLKTIGLCGPQKDRGAPIGALGWAAQDRTRSFDPGNWMRINKRDGSDARWERR